MFLLLSLLGICISLPKSCASFLHKGIKYLATSLKAVINCDSISTRTHFSISLHFPTVLLHLCLLFLSNRSALKLYIKILSTFSYKISFDINLWMPSFFLSVPLWVISNFKFGIPKLCWSYKPLESSKFLQRKNRYIISKIANFIDQDRNDEKLTFSLLYY